VIGVAGLKRRRTARVSGSNRVEVVVWWRIGKYYDNFVPLVTFSSFFLLETQTSNSKNQAKSLDAMVEDRGQQTKVLAPGNSRMVLDF
jgi:hypothetical protein